MDHGGGDEGEGVLPQAEGVLLPHHDALIRVILAVKILHHGEGLGGGDDGRLGIGAHEAADAGRVVRLHVLHDEVIRLSVPQGGGEIIQPGVGEALGHRVHDGDLFIQNDIGIIGHAQGHDVLPLEQVDLMVVDADIADVLADLHVCFLSRFPFGIVLFVSIACL